mgnify:CR=1 FL=1
MNPAMELPDIYSHFDCPSDSDVFAVSTTIANSSKLHCSRGALGINPGVITAKFVQAIASSKRTTDETRLMRLPAKL